MRVWRSVPRVVLDLHHDGKGSRHPDGGGAIGDTGRVKLITRTQVSERLFSPPYAIFQSLR